ncbi:MAG: class I SAM-dependent methyltransferase, partial [Bacteroidota bacterium]
MDLHTIYCPSCRHPLAGSSGLQGEKRCPQCGAAFAIRGDIVDFIPQDDFYWGETDQAKIRRINDQAEASGDWYGSITRNLADRPRLIRYITDSSRMGWLFHVYDERNHAACLDVGSGWGMISFGLSHFYDTVYSLDGVYERLRFQSIRARSDGVDNIRFLRSSLLKLPLGDHSLDLIALNGVLEWVGLSDPNREPDELQRMFLAEIARLLKPEGKVFLGIENRFGLQYLLGHKDHSGLSFTSLAPRPVADWMVARSTKNGQKRPRKREFFHRAQTRYRTYTYSLWGYRRLLSQAGLDQFRPYWAWQSYSYPRMSGSMDASSLRFVAENLSSSFRRPWQRLALRLLSFVPRRVSSSLIRLFAPYFLIIAGPGGEDGTLQQRVLAADPAAQSFVRLSLSPSPGLDTTYLLLDGRANVSRLVRVGEPGHSPTGRGTFEVVEEQGGVGRPIRLHDRGEVILAARWLAEFQSGSKKGRWSERQLADEMRALTEAALSLPGFDDLRLRLKDFESRYLNALSSRGLSMVSEQGDFTPLNLLITPQGELT